MKGWNEGALVGGDDLRSWSSRFLNFRSFSNFSRPGLKDLTLGGVGCLGGVLGGYLVLGDDVLWAYEGEELLGVRIRRLELPPTFSHSQPLGPRLFGINRRGQRGECGFLYLLVWGETTGASFSVFDAATGRRVLGFGSGFFGAFFPGQTAER